MICNLGVVGSTPSIGSEKFFYKRIFAEDAKSDAEDRKNSFFEVYFGMSPRRTSDERRSNLRVVRSEDAKSDAEIARKKRKTGEYQSGQMGQTVNLLVYTFGGSNPSSPTNSGEV